MDTLYSIIYDWFSTYVFVGLPACSWEIGGQNITLEAWLNHSATILVLCVFAFLLFSLAVWLFKLIGGCLSRVAR